MACKCIVISSLKQSTDFPETTLYTGLPLAQTITTLNDNHKRYYIQFLASGTPILEHAIALNDA